MPTKENAFYFEGHIDKVENGWFSGWLWRSDLPNDPISVDLYVDDNHESTILAAAYRADLEKAGKGNGRHAFEIKLPGRCHNGQAHLIRLCYHGTVLDLHGSPQSVSLEPIKTPTQRFKSAEHRVHFNELLRQTDQENFGDRPTVSVIIPCYNLGAYLDQAVQSVLDQTYGDFEILIIDDGSTDPATRHLFASYQRPKTRILRTQNQGLARARNFGIKEARGRYVFCLDAEDLIEPTFLERTVGVLESDPSVAFASCWLRAFGEAEYELKASTCTFPHLLAENTVCRALMRKDAVLQIGGFDPNMPVSGYEDWDLAITLAERGMRGMIIPEYLFRSRIRHGSMSASCNEPENHSLLMSYLVEKHVDSYKQHLSGVLEAIETRTLELEEGDRPAGVPNTNPEVAQRLAFLENALRSVLQSRTWRLTQPLRDSFGGLQRMTKFVDASKKGSPRISVVVSCGSDPENLRSSVESLWFLLGSGGQIILVDDTGSRDPLMSAMLEWYGEAGFEVLRMDGGGATRAREAGLKHVHAPVLFAMSAGDTLDATAFRRAQEVLASDNGIVFVSGGILDHNTGFAWVPQSADLTGFLTCPRVAFPMVRCEALSRVGNYDGSFSKPVHADWDLTLRLAMAGERGMVLPDPLVSCRSRRIFSRSVSADGSVNACHVRQVVDKHRGIFDRHCMQVVLGHENLRRQLEAQLEGTKLPLPDSSTPKPVDWGGLRRLEPVSPVWGLDRGQPVDRYYIEEFLSQHRDDIHGPVLEVKDPGYTQAYGQGVEMSDVVDVAPENSSATLICDLSAKGSLPENTYDCFILTQTMHIIYDIRKVVENAYRTLRPGGVLLATLPCVSRVDYESGLEGDCWRFTPASARHLFEEVFGAGQVEIEAYGNVLVCSSFLMGLSSADLTPAELNHQDPYFPLLVCVRAVKPEPMLIESGPTASRTREKALVLLYHRIDRSSHDRWNLCVSPENFAAHMGCLRRCFRPVRLSEIMAMLEDGAVQRGSVAITFDDGYRDNLANAMPILKQTRVPATFFISGDAASVDESFWWERLDGSMRLMELDELRAKELHRRLMDADIEERNGTLAGLPQPNDPLPKRLSREELKALACEPLADIGAHGWSHRSLSDLSIESQREEVMQSIRILSDVVGARVRFFAYPFGGPANAQLAGVLREAGIELAFTVTGAAVTLGCDPWAIPRLEVRNWNEADFEAKLRLLLDD